MKKQQRGFTLLEILIVIAIVGILAAIAVPSYQNSVIRANRTEGKDALLRAAALQEKEFIRQGNQYIVDDSNINLIGGAYTENGYYQILVSNAPCGSAACFTLTASPLPNAPQSSDSACGPLTLDNFGRTGAGGANPDDCW